MIKKENQIVVDASAILALITNEDGKEEVEDVLDKAIISTVNFSEIITVTNRNGLDELEITHLLKNILPNIIDFNYEQACIAASFDKDTKKIGLSLGDRSCLALAKYRNLPVLTADKVWQKLDIGVDVRLIR